MSFTILPEGEYAEIALADRTRRRSRKRQVLLIRLLLLAGIVGLWQWAAGRVIDDSWLSSPSEIAQRLWSWTLDGTLPYNSWITLQEMGIGFVIGASTGVIAGLALGLSETVGDTLHPFVLAVYSLPKVAMGPLFILWFGIDMEMKAIALSAITVFFLGVLECVCRKPAGRSGADRHRQDDGGKPAAADREDYRAGYARLDLHRAPSSRFPMR